MKSLLSKSSVSSSVASSWSATTRVLRHPARREATQFGRVARAAGSTFGARSAVEPLESRQLFAVNVVSPISNFAATSGQFPSTFNLRDVFQSTTISGPVVRFSLSVGSASANLDVELFNATPQSRDNFLRYVDAGRYDDTFFHRSISGFVVQGGGYALATGGAAISKFEPVRNEFNLSPRDSQGRVNTRGTLAMAKLPATNDDGTPIPGGGPDSATNEFFVNVADNSSNLDAQNGGFTTFARVLGAGMLLVDQINGLPTNSGLSSPFETLPVVDYTAGQSVGKANLVYVNSARRVSPLTFEASSSNSSLVTPSIDTTTGKLTLAYVPGATGEAEITLDARDLDGGSSTLKFSVNVQSAANVSVSLGGTRIDDPSGATVANFGFVRPPAAGTQPVFLNLTLRSVGNATLTNLDYTLPAGFSLVTPGPTTIAPGDAPTLTVAVDTTTFGTKTGDLFINVPGGAISSVRIPLQATVRLPVVLGAGGVKSVTFRSGATNATFSLSGRAGGTATVLFGGEGITASAVRGGRITVAGAATVASITFDGTTAGNTFALAAQGGGASLINIATVTTVGTSSLGTLTLTRANLTGNLTFGTTTATNAVLNRLSLGQASNAVVFLGTNNDPKAEVSIAVARVENATFSLGYAAKTFDAKVWNAVPGTAALTGTTVRSLTIGSNFAGDVTLTNRAGINSADVKGNVTAGRWTVDGQLAKFSARAVSSGVQVSVESLVGNFAVAGDFSGELSAQAIRSFAAASGNSNPSIVAGGAFNDENVQVVQGDIGKVTFTGNVSGAYVAALNTIGAFSANAIAQTRVYAGVNPPSGSLFPTAASQFSNPSRIGTFRLTGRGVAEAFATAAVSARVIDSIDLGRVRAVSGGSNGIVGVSIGRLRATMSTGQKIDLRSINSTKPVTINPPSSTQQADFRVTLLSPTSTAS